MLLNDNRLAGLDVDGRYGSRTASAVTNYQTAYSLDADGKVGNDTWESLQGRLDYEGEEYDYSGSTYHRYEAGGNYNFWHRENGNWYVSTGGDDDARGPRFN